MRLIAENWPSLLPRNKLDAFDEWKTVRLHDNDAGGAILDEMARAKDATSVKNQYDKSQVKKCIKYYKKLCGDETNVDQL